MITVRRRSAAANAADGPRAPLNDGGGQAARGAHPGPRRGDGRRGGGHPHRAAPARVHADRRHHPGHAQVSTRGSRRQPSAGPGDQLPHPAGRPAVRPAHRGARGRGGAQHLVVPAVSRLPAEVRDGGFIAEDPEDLREAVESGRSALRTIDDARAAIIACYVAMENSLAERGAARAVADTPDELLARATSERPGARHRRRAADRAVLRGQVLQPSAGPAGSATRPSRPSTSSPRRWPHPRPRRPPVTGGPPAAGRRAAGTTAAGTTAAW